MSLSRRAFLRAAASSAAAWPLVARAQGSNGPERVFRHGVASGDPLSDRVILWTRVTPTNAPSGIPSGETVDVRWQIAIDEHLTHVVARGTVPTTAERDFTVKVDVEGLLPGRVYFYAFGAGGEQSPIGRTRTLPLEGVERVRLAVVSCSNYPAGYFNVYRCVANRQDLDAVVHVGDYIYEVAGGVFADTKAIGRAPLALGEAATLVDYRLRYATYRTDPDLQEAHRQHPFIVVWDDHEIANDAWSGGSATHDARLGDWATRLAGAYRAYLEWLPVREAAGSGIRLYRSFRIGNMADLIMLDTRALRDRQVATGQTAGLNDPRRTMLGDRQEAWLFDQLRASQSSGTRWRLLGQQVLFSPISPTGQPLSGDMWDGYPAARARLLDFVAREQVTDLAVLTGDIHSSWAIDVSANPWAAAGNPAARPLAVEFVTPAISSAPLFADETLRARAPLLRAVDPHVKFFDGDANGYVLLDVTRDRLHADWYFVPSVRERSDRELKSASLVCERGSSRLTPA